VSRDIWSSVWRHGGRRPGGRAGRAALTWWSQAAASSPSRRRQPRWGNLSTPRLIVGAGSVRHPFALRSALLADRDLPRSSCRGYARRAWGRRHLGRAGRARKSSRCASIAGLLGETRRGAALAQGPSTSTCSIAGQRAQSRTCRCRKGRCAPIAMGLEQRAPTAGELAAEWWTDVGSGHGRGRVGLSKGPFYPPADTADATSWWRLCSEVARRDARVRRFTCVESDASWARSTRGWIVERQLGRAPAHLAIQDSRPRQLGTRVDELVPGPGARRAPARSTPERHATNSLVAGFDEVSGRSCHTGPSAA